MGQHGGRRISRPTPQPLAGLGALWGVGGTQWTMTPSGVRGVLNDAVSIYFLDATLASAFVVRWCAGSIVETVPHS